MNHLLPFFAGDGKEIQPLQEIMTSGRAGGMKNSEPLKAD
jgi:hypothetical protein